MAIPASVIPAGNSYSVHVAGPDSAGMEESRPVSNILTVTAATAGALLKIHKVDVRQHLTGDDARSQETRDFLTKAGAKASAFSPAPSPGIAGEGFWKTTLAVVATQGGQDFWWPVRTEKKVEWDCLLVALYDQREGKKGISELPAPQVFLPDLWVVATHEDPAGVVDAWIGRGAGAVAVIGPQGVSWASRNASCGNARGFRPFAQPLSTTDFTFGCFAGALVAALIEELLGENLFDKSWVRVDRADLETRPLHVSRACAFAAAAARATQGAEAPERLLQKSGDLLGRIRTIQTADNPGGPAKPWGSKGR